MPIYEFRCLTCGNLVEILFTSSEQEANLACPECRGESLERVVSVTRHVMGVGKQGKKAKLTSKSCGSGSECHTLDLPGPAPR